MALSTPHARPWSPARVPYRLLLIGLAVVVGLGGTYVAVAGNPFGSLGLNVASNVCCERSSVRPGAIKTPDDRLLIDAPFRSRVP